MDTSSTASARMALQRQRDTGPEVLLRRALHRFGFRYRIDHKIPGMPRRRIDIAFASAQVAVFVDGCFWHACPEHGQIPKSNAAFWSSKLERNVVRDRETDAHLREQGWLVVRVWEHEGTDDAAERIRRILLERQRPQDQLEPRDATE